MPPLWLRDQCKSKQAPLFIGGGGSASLPASNLRIGARRGEGRRGEVRGGEGAPTGCSPLGPTTQC